MDQSKVDALRDIAIEFIPQAKRLLAASSKMSNDDYQYALFAVPVSTLARASTSAVEKAAARLLSYTMQLTIQWDDDHKLSKSDRRNVTAYAVNAAHQLCELTGKVIAWLPPLTQQIELEEDVETPAARKTPTITRPPPGINLTTAEAAKLLHRNPQTLRSWSSNGDGPIHPKKSGRSLQWPSDAVLTLMDNGWT